ncbi:MAG: hypothetical protein MUP74_00995 [Desulfobacterales bacterium]|nr:hypothetical protein [Desulfobacterales bacterium]
MKKQITIAAIGALFVLTLSLPSPAAEKSHSGMDHSSHAQGTAPTGGMDHSAHMGALIHESTVEGFSLAYHLIDMQQHTAGMKDMPMTHHLMVFVKGPDLKTVTEAKAGYLVQNPDGTDQRLMTMAMKEGFGADINLKAKGVYTIKAKIVAQDKQLMDSFPYEVK